MTDELEKLRGALEVLARVKKTDVRIIKYAKENVMDHKAALAAHCHLLAMGGGEDGGGGGDRGAREWRTALDAAAVALIDGALADMATMSTKTRMDMEGPWAGTMALGTILGVLAAAGADLLGGAAWGHAGPLLGNAYVVHSHLCISDKPLAKYSVADLLLAYEILGYRWWRLRPCAELRAYILALLHHGCMLIAQPGSARVHDVRALRRMVRRSGVARGSPIVYAGNGNLVLRVAGAGFRMLFMASLYKFWELGDPADLARDAGCRGDMCIDRVVERMRAFIERNARDLDASSSIKMDVLKDFPVMYVSHTDRDVFAQSQKMERERFQGVQILAKTGEANIACQNLRQGASLYQIVRLAREESPEYDAKFTYPVHIYGILMKLYVFAMPFHEAMADMDMEFENAFLVWEHFLDRQFAEVSSEPHPMLVNLMGRIHLVYQSKLYLCDAIEQALALWCVVCLNKHYGQVALVDVGAPIRSIIMPDPRGAAAAARDAMGEDVADVTEGDILE